MLRALLFDFDGVLADTEPLHFGAFQDLLREEGIALAKEEYYSEFLGLDDRGCFQAVYQKAGQNLSSQKMRELIRRKNQIILQKIESDSLLLPHVHELFSALGGRYYLAIVSGALKNEILAILTKERMHSFFQVIVSAEQVISGKPDPEGFLTALKFLNRDFVQESELLLPEECLVIEDSPWGIEAARRGGMKSVAVTNSYKSDDLKGADWVVDSLLDLKGILGVR